MPLFFNKIILNQIHLSVWNLKDTTSKELDGLVLTKIQENSLSEISNEHKKKEFYGGVLVLNALASFIGLENVELIKDEHGKPHFKESDWEISLTHTLDFVVAVAQKNKAIGIDLERPQTKILRIIDRLYTATEIDFIGTDISKACIYWSAKEALYKLYGKREIDFKEHLFLYWQQNELLGHIKIKEYDNEHRIYIENLGKYYLVIAY